MATLGLLVLESDRATYNCMMATLGLLVLESDRATYMYDGHIRAPSAGEWSPMKVPSVTEWS